MSVLNPGDTVTPAAPEVTMADRAGFDEFVVSRSGALLRTAYLLTRDRHLAEDLVQTALAKAWFAPASGSRATRSRTCAGSS